MAGFIAEMAHHRIIITSLTVVTMHTRCPIRETKRLFDFLPVGTEKIAVGVCPEDFAAGEIEGNLFTASSHEPKA